MTIRLIIERFIKPGTLVNTDKYDIYGRLPEWGYEHKVEALVCVNPEPV